MDIQGFIDEYTAWLKNEITFSKMGEYYEITTPFLDSSNDYLQIYVKQEGGDIIFSDDAYTINSLELSGFQLTAKQKDRIKKIASQFGLSIASDNELIAKSPIESAPQKKQMFLQAMQKIDDLCMMTHTRNVSFFAEDVNDFFKKEKIYASENISLAGKTGYSHLYDYLFARTESKPERLCNLINNPDKRTMELHLWHWLDTMEIRQGDSRFILFLNDARQISQEILDAASNYNVSCVKWSERENPENLQLFAK